MIVTVTMNAAIDRTLTVPNFQRGQRHRASAGLTLAGGKGINIARALKRPARLPVPALPLRLALGAFADELLLGGQRVMPKAALASGFVFDHATIDEALEKLQMGDAKERGIVAVGRQALGVGRQLIDETAKLRIGASLM